MSEPAVRRKTEAAGAAYVAWQTQEVERIESALPPAPPGPTIEHEVVCQPVSPPASQIQPIAPLPTTKKAPYRPGPDHPWRHSPIGRARYRTDTWSRLEKSCDLCN